MEECSTEPSEEPVVEKETTVPKDAKIVFIGIDEDFTAKLAPNLIVALQEIGKRLDLSLLDGITVASDYSEALKQLDRGKEGLKQLVPTTEHVLGVAMSPRVYRGEEIKTHIVLSLLAVGELADINNPNVGLCIHTVAHECAHVHDHAVFDRQFPGIASSSSEMSLMRYVIKEISEACWTEYSACFLSSGTGASPLEGYADTFEKALSRTRSDANQKIKNYRLHQNIQKVVIEVAGEYGNLMKWASYFYGEMAGSNTSLESVPLVREALHGHWFKPFYDRLAKELDSLTENYGEWKSHEDIYKIGEIAIDLCEIGGVSIVETAGIECRIDVPVTWDTMPF